MNGSPVAANSAGLRPNLSDIVPKQYAPIITPIKTAKGRKAFSVEERCLRHPTVGAK